MLASLNHSCPGLVMFAEWATCVFPNAFLWSLVVPTDKEDRGRDGKMISLLAAPSSRLTGKIYWFDWEIDMHFCQGRSQTFQNEGVARGLRCEQGGWLGLIMAALHRPLYKVRGKRGKSFCQRAVTPQVKWFHNFLDDSMYNVLQISNFSQLTN